MAIRTTLVEIQTNDGRTAVVESDGWRCNDATLLPRLVEQAPIDASVSDPLLHAAHLACYAVGGRIVRMRRAPTAGLGGVVSTLGRALTDSSLQKALTNADEINHRLGSTQLRSLKMSRLVALAMWCSAGAASAVAWWLLMR